MSSATIQTVCTVLAGRTGESGWTTRKATAQFDLLWHYPKVANVAPSDGLEAT